MKLHFYKYQSAGNDFVLLDNRDNQFRFSEEEIRGICDRKQGVGADGIILVELHPSFDFTVTYYNCDGSKSLCCNGYRAAVSFASSKNIVPLKKTTFYGFDSAYFAEILPDGKIRLEMPSVSKFERIGADYFVNIGIPHYVKFVEDAMSYPVFNEGKKIRCQEEFQPEGVNANFVELLSGNSIFVRTFERGVEDETLSCATGAVAAAAAAFSNGYSFPITVKTRGGELGVELHGDFLRAMPDQTLVPLKVFLEGPASFVFEGDFEL